MNGSLQKQSTSKPLPKVHATFWRTDIPEIPHPCPRNAKISLDLGMLVVGESLSDLPSFELYWTAQDLKEVRVHIMPDLGDEVDAQWIKDDDMSRMVVHHADPYEVVPHLETEFRTLKSYWFRALAKGLKELGVPVFLEEGTRPKGWKWKG